MSNKFKILSLQFESKNKSKDKNLKKLTQLMKENADFKADIVILPECWSVGHDYSCYQDEAEVIPAQTTMLLSSLAEEHNTNIIAGSIIEKTSEAEFYNTCMVFNRKGVAVGKYRKNHTFSHCGSDESKFIKNGSETCVVEIENVKLGLAICYDIRFPELFRKMVKEGAEVFVVPAAFPYERIKQWEILNQARALENLAFLISCNQFGSSNCVNPYGQIIHTSKQGEIIQKYTVDIDEVRRIRKETPFLSDILS